MEIGSLFNSLQNIVKFFLARMDEYKKRGSTLFVKVYIKLSGVYRVIWKMRSKLHCHLSGLLNAAHMWKKKSVSFQNMFLCWLEVCTLFKHDIWLFRIHYIIKCGMSNNVFVFYTHSVKIVQMRGFFWPVFSLIQTEYKNLLRKSPYSVRIR